MSDDRRARIDRAIKLRHPRRRSTAGDSGERIARIRALLADRVPRRRREPAERHDPHETAGAALEERRGH